MAVEVCCLGDISQKRGDAPQKREANMTTSTMQVSGMKCRKCTSAVEDGLGALAGVHAVKADLETSVVAVEHESGAISKETLAAEIEQLGFEVA